MKYDWYHEVTSHEPLTQGDILEDVPVLVFPQTVDAATDLSTMADSLAAGVGLEPVRAVVMTQACDLEHDHVRFVQLCPVLALSEFKPRWEDAERARSQKPTPTAWSRALDGIKAGRVWNYTMLNSYAVVGGLSQEHAIVDFHEVFSLPVSFLRNLVRNRGNRLQLCPPYREHLSQAFARYFMRVGLPIGISIPT